MPKITFITPQGQHRAVDAPSGLTLLQVARQFDLPIEGACGGALACATCHVVVEPSWYDRLPCARHDEQDMLDMAWHPGPTSRLGCQVVVTEDMDGLVVKIANGR